MTQTHPDSYFLCWYALLDTNCLCDVQSIERFDGVSSRLPMSPLPTLPTYNMPNATMRYPQNYFATCSTSMMAHSTDGPCVSYIPKGFSSHVVIITCLLFLRDTKPVTIDSPVSCIVAIDGVPPTTQCFAFSFLIAIPVAFSFSPPHRSKLQSYKAGWPVDAISSVLNNLAPVLNSQYVLCTP